MKGIITKADMALMAEINADPVAKEMLAAKCRWEQMGRYAVLASWGDPRTWPSYEQEKKEQGR